LGRYIQSDPIGLTGGASTFSYVTSKPLTAIDRLGLDTYLAGVNGGATFLGGGGGALGVYFNPGLTCGQKFDVGIYSSETTAAGFNAGGGVYGGVLHGPASELAGRTYDASLTVGPVQSTYSTGVSGVSSVTAGWSAGIPGGGTFSTTTTQTYGVSDAANTAASLYWNAMNQAASAGAAQHQ